MSKMIRSSAINGKRFVFVTFMPVFMVKLNYVRDNDFECINFQATWHRAAHVCKFNGMELAALNSVDEHNTIVKLAEATGGKSFIFTRCS